MSVLPISLSPHICVLPSVDLVDLLSVSSLPPLPQILQSFSPLPQVTTRTVALVSVPHSSFALRFSDLAEIEAACREDEERRAERTLDWIASRLQHRCPRWVDDVEKLPEKDDFRTPWWDEMRRCIEGDHIPSKLEAWNHPVALILAVSTTGPNPLQAITNLQARALDLPPWVDRNILRYTLIVHPQNSPLSDEEAVALFNAVKKQYGLHSYLLSLSMPIPPPTPVPVPALIPRLPPPPPPGSPNPPSLEAPETRHTLKMSEADIQQTARFTREFVVMSLLPWMEKCVLEWNESFSSTRRLPSRIFSSTRRLFVSQSPSASVAHNHSSSVVSSRTSSVDNQLPTGASPPSQLRRLAEFATVLGDLKLAVSVWEALRKESKGGSDILPLLLSPSLTLPLHASNALSAISSTSAEPSAFEQFMALKYAVRWEVGISHSEFISQPLEGERWLVWAAGNAEEPTSALLLAHAALLSSRKHAQRRAALWYWSAADRLEKCGIKPLTMHFLRKAHKLYKNRPEKFLSPSFWDLEGKIDSDIQAFDVVMAGIEHPLGRLLYTTGNIAGAVRCFLGLLRGSQAGLPGIQPQPPAMPISDTSKPLVSDKVFLDDFRVAFTHFKTNFGDIAQLADLKLPFSFCIKRHTCVRIPGDNATADSLVWEAREEAWRTHRRSKGYKEDLKVSGKAYVDETFWVDLVLLNPLEVEINLSNVTVIARETNNPETAPDFLEIDVIDDIVIGPKETQKVSLRVKSSRATSLVFTHTTYDFLSLLPSSEPLSSRGRRLHDTPAQRQKPTYAPDITIKIEVEEAHHRLMVDFAEDSHFVLAQGERKSTRLWLNNAGSLPLNEVWIIVGQDDVIWIGENGESRVADDSESFEILESKNSLALPTPHRLFFGASERSSTLNPGGSMDIPVILHADIVGERNLRLLFVYRQKETDPFQSVRVSRSYEVYPLLDALVTSRSSRSLGHLFIVSLELFNNSSEEIRISQVSSLSATWMCTPLSEDECQSLLPKQSVRLLLGVDRRHGMITEAERTLAFVSSKIGDVLQGGELESSYPPAINLLCTHLFGTIEPIGKRPSTWHLLSRNICNIMSDKVHRSHPHIPPQSLQHIFPLHNPASVDFVIFWTVPSQQLPGHTFIPGPTLGAFHAPLEDAIERAENMKTRRSIFAETQRAKEEILQSIRESEWNEETNPIILIMQEPATVTHNFGQGPCRIPITLTLRNYSPTRSCRFALGLSQDPIPPTPISTLPPPYIGQLRFQGTLEPTASKVLRPLLWVTRPGTYNMGTWYLEVEVLESDRRIRHRYRLEQQPVDDQIVVVLAMES